MRSLDYFKGVWEESMKIKWISKDEVISSSLAVLLVTAFIMLFVLLIDSASIKSIRLLLEMR